jgi:hypothetical protein
MHFSGAADLRKTLQMGETAPEASTPAIAVPVALNTIFALAGIIWVDKEPASLAAVWRERLAPDEEIYSFYESHQFPLGPHYLNWLSPREYRHYYKQEWSPPDRTSGGLAALHLLAANLERCVEMIAASGRTVMIIEHEHNGLRTLWVPPAWGDGPAFHITQQSLEEWAQARSALTGERFTLS